MSRPSISFDRVADRYDKTRGGLARGRAFATDIRPWLADGGPVLEIGVGTGVVATALTDAGTPVVGVDISHLMARQARERLGPRVALADALALPISDACVGGVLFIMVLHVVGDVEAALGEAARVVRAGGRVVTVHARPETTPTDIDGGLAGLDVVRTSRLDDIDALLIAAEGSGLTHVHSGWTTPQRIARTPNAVADEIEGRVWSFLWPLSDNDWRALAVPAVRALRALPEPDRPRTYTQRHRLTVFAR